MATRDETIRLKFEALGVKDVDGLTNALDSLEQEAKQGDKAAKALVDQLDALAEQARKASEFARLTAEVDELQQKFDLANEEAYNLKVGLQAVENPSKQAQQEFAKATKSLAQLGEQLGKQERALKSIGDELDAAGIDTKRLVTEEIRLRDESGKTAAAVQSQVKSLEANREAARKNAEALAQLSKSFATAREQANKIATTIAKAGAAAAAAAAAFAVYKTGQFFSGAIESAAEFERQISEIAAVTGATGDELELLRTTARKAALESGIGFSDVTSTLGELARAVGDAEKATAILAPTLNLATAGGLEAAKAAEILTTTLTQFGLDALEATRVADLLSNGANATTASVEQLGNSLSYAAPLARQLGMSVDSTVAAIGALADEGFRGERAGTALRNVLSALANPTSKLNGELDNLGIKTRNFNEVVVELAAKGEAGKRALLALDAEARPAILALVNSGATNIARLTESFAAMQVTAAGAASTIRDNLQGAADQAGVAFDGLRQDLVEPILAPLTEELQMLAQGLRDFAKSPEFATIQQALKNLFIEGTAAAKEFIGTVDFVALANQIAAFADDASGKLKTFGEDSREFFGYIAEAANGLQIAFNALQTGIFGIAAALAKAASLGAEWAALQARILSLVPAANAAAKAIGVDLDAAVEELTLKGGALDAVYQEFADRTIANANETAAAIDQIGTSSDAAAEAGKAIGTGIEQTLKPVLPELQAVDAGIRGLLPATQEAAAGYGVLRQASDQATQSLARGSATAGAAVATVEASAQSATTVLSELIRQQQALALELASARVSGAAISELQRLQAEYDKTAARIAEIRTLLAQPAPAAPSPVQQQVVGIKDAADAATGAVQQTAAAAQEGKTASLGYTDALAAFVAEFGAVSESALQLFLKFQRGTIGVGISLEKSSLSLLEAAKATREAIDAQQEQASQLVTIYGDVAKEAETLGEVIAQTGYSSAEAFEGFAQAVREGRADVNLLNQADLDRLAASAEAAAAKVRQIQQEAIDATAELAELNRSLQDRADERAGNLLAIEQRRYEEELLRIEALAKRGGELARQQYAEARRLADEEHRARLAEIAAEDAARKKSQGGGGSGGSNPPPRPSGGGSGGGGGGGVSSSGREVNITVNTFGTLSPAARRDFAKQLDRDLEIIAKERRSLGR